MDVGDVEDQLLIVEQIERDAAPLERLEEELLLDPHAAVEHADARVLLTPVLFFLRGERQRQRRQARNLELGAAPGALGDLVLHHVGQRDLGETLGALRLPAGGWKGH